jgi:hypothetical protein
MIQSLIRFSQDIREAESEDNIIAFCGENHQGCFCFYTGLDIFFLQKRNLVFDSNGQAIHCATPFEHFPQFVREQVAIELHKNQKHGGE